jgi:hypothetical protein
LSATQGFTWDQFDHDAGRNLLRNVCSSQAIRLAQQGAGSWVFDYEDGEAAIAIPVRQRAREFSVDFRPLTSVVRTYGLWRRLAFFLPDALAFWFLGGREPLEPWLPSKVDLLGGWQNGAWDPALFVRCSVFVRADPKLHDFTPGTPIALCPLQAPPPRWRFVNAPRVEPEVKLNTIPAADMPLLDHTVPIDEQIAGAPRFIRQDGGAVLFHRRVEVNFHRGEDYDPLPRYGYCNRNVAFSFYAHSSSGVGSYDAPVLLHDAAPDSYFVRRTAINDRILVAPALALREELFFSLIDIIGVRRTVRAELPVIREADQAGFAYYRDRLPEDEYAWTGIKFGSHLDTIDDLPMRSPAGIARTSFGYLPGW